MCIDVVSRYCGAQTSTVTERFYWTGSTTKMTFVMSCWLLRKYISPPEYKRQPHSGHLKWKTANERLEPVQSPYAGCQHDIPKLPVEYAERRWGEENMSD